MMRMTMMVSKRMKEQVDHDDNKEEEKKKKKRLEYLYSKKSTFLIN